MTREKIENFREVILPFNRRVLLKIDYEGLGASDAEEFAKDFNEILNLAIKALEQKPTTKNDLGVDCISREDVLMCLTGEFENREYELSELIKIFLKRIKALPSVTPQEPQSFKWCTDCREYDQEKHCCHRYSKVIRDTVAEIRQEPILDKIRAEIKRMLPTYHNLDWSITDLVPISEVLKLIDKYKAESEDKK